MFYYLSIVIIVVSNVIYHLASKKVPENSNPFFFVMVSYVVGFVVALVAFALSKGEKGIVDALTEQSKLINWAPVVLGVSVIGLEVGNVLMYRAGWDMSKGSLTSNILLALVLVVVGVLVFKEDFSGKHIAGIFSCLVGLYLLA